MTDYIATARSRKSGIGLYVPVNFSPSKLPKQQRIYAAYLLNLIHWKSCCWQRDAQGYVPLKYEYLIKVIPRDIYRQLWRRLILELKVIESDLHSIVGRKCQGYRLAEPYRETKRITTTNAALIAAIDAAYGTECAINLKVHQWLRGHLHLLTIDHDRALDIVETMQPKPKKLKKGQQPISVDDYRRLLRDQVQRLANGDTFLVADKYGRVHTPVTSLPKLLRCCVRLDGQPLAGLDLKNSQPLMLGIIAAQYYSSHKSAQRLRDRTYRPGSNPYHRRRPSPVETDREDLNQYLEMCQSGKVYESFGTNRQRTKKGFFNALFGQNHWRDGIRDQLAEQFPTVFKTLQGVKRRNYRSAAHLLQNVESTIFIHGICGRLKRRHPDVPVITIHDSLLTTPRNLGKVRRAILDEFVELNLSPSLTKETYKHELHTLSRVA